MGRARAAAAVAAGRYRAGPGDRGGDRRGTGGRQPGRGPLGVPGSGAARAGAAGPRIRGEPGNAGLNALAARIRATGRSATVLSLPGDGTGDLVEQAAILNKAVTEALRQGAPSVDLVGYSAGGVVVLLWTVRYGGSTPARRVVTLGSPVARCPDRGDRRGARTRALPDGVPAVGAGQQPAGRDRSGPGTRQAAVAVGLDPGRPDRTAPGIGPAARRGERRRTGRVPGRAGAARAVAHRRAGHGDGAAGHRYRQSGRTGARRLRGLTCRASS